MNLLKELNQLVNSGNAPAQWMLMPNNDLVHDYYNRVLCDEEMGEWQSIEYAHLPIALSNIWYIREAVRATLKKAGYDG